MSLIAIMSVGVISLVVCLVAIFLSVTEGIENTWLKKLTSLHAPIRITPTPAYYSSYYYQVDSISAASDYQNKNIREKYLCTSSNPYVQEMDMEVPPYWPRPDMAPSGTLKDPVKTAFTAIQSLQKKYPDLLVDDYEICGAMLRLGLRRGQPSAPGRQPSQNFITQASYVCSFPEKSPIGENLLLAPTAKDCLQILQKVEYDTHASMLESKNGEAFSKAIKNVFAYLTIEELSSPPMWQIPHSLFPEKIHLSAKAYVHKGSIVHLTVAKESARKKNSSTSGILQGFVTKTASGLIFESGKEKYVLENSTPLYLEEATSFQVKLIQDSLETSQDISGLTFSAKGSLQNTTIEGTISLTDMEVTKCTYVSEFTEKPLLSPLWVYSVKAPNKPKEYLLPKDSSGSFGIIISKNFQDSGARIGDKGHFTYLAPTSSSIQEQQIPVYVAGFYDPGIMSIGHRSIFADAGVVRSLNSSSHLSTVDKLLSNGIHVWNSDLQKTKDMKNEIQKAFAQSGIDKYWTVTTFHEYDFSKDLLQQFQSDKYLFSLVGIIILLVACSNIISLLVLLVNDKKKEIGILQAMGTSPSSIAIIFGLCGTFLGVVSSGLGILGAYFLLHNIDTVVHLLSSFQGHDAFNPAFYGNSLPKELSGTAIKFILYTTPFLSLCAGLIPAIKACLLQPSQMLRNE